MSSDDFWDLFAETGDIRYYLLYVEAAGKRSPQEDDVAEDTVPAEK